MDSGRAEDLPFGNTKIFPEVLAHNSGEHEPEFTPNRNLWTDTFTDRPNEWAF